MMNFATLQGLSIPEGVVTQIAKDGVVLWKLETSKPIILEVEKFASDTYAGEITYEDEEFLILDIYPKANGTVKVTYGNLTKTITDTSGAAEPNAQQVFFGTFNGVSDSVATPASGILTIEGDYRGFGCGTFATSSKVTGTKACIKAVENFGTPEFIPTSAFQMCGSLTSLSIPESVASIGDKAFYGCNGLTNVSMLATTPPILEGDMVFDITTCSITVPKGCGATYKSAEYWSEYADRIVEAS